MTAYTEGPLDKLSKREITGIALSLQNKVKTCSNANNDPLSDICKFSKNFVKLRSKTNIVEKVNALINNSVVDIKRQCWRNAQYSTRECLEVVSILVDVCNEDLGSNVFKVFNTVGCKILSHHIETFNRLMNNNDRIIVKFSRRKDCDQVMSVERDLSIF